MSRRENGALAAAAALSDGTRREVYRLVRESGSATRAVVASALGITARAAAFHLDALLDAGVLRASYSRREGKGGPGAGRPAKVYEAAGDIAITIPERRYEDAARILADAVERTGAANEAVALAGQRGAALGRDVGGGTRSAGAAFALADAILSRHGYDPVVTNGALIPRNCPFESLANSGELICAMNARFIGELAAALGLDACATPDGGCCTGIVRPR